MADRICVMNARPHRADRHAAARSTTGRAANIVARFFGDNNLIAGALADGGGGERSLDTALGRLALPRRRPAGAGRSCRRAAGHARRAGRRRSRSRRGRPDAEPAVGARLEEVSFVGADRRRSRLRPRGRPGARADGQAAEPRRRPRRSTPGAGGRLGWRAAERHAGAGVSAPTTPATRAQPRRRLPGWLLAAARLRRCPSLFILRAAGALPDAQLLLRRARAGSSTRSTLRNYVRFFTDPIFLPIFLRTCLLCARRGGDRACCSAIRSPTSSPACTGRAKYAC